MGRLCRRTGSDAVETLRSRAPSWLAQLPAFGAEGERAELARRSQGATRERLTEELADALEDLAARRPLVLVLEDLHWCDRATLGLLAALAQRPEPARLLIVATVRTGEPTALSGPLWKLLAELKGKRRCQELALRPLAEAEVGEVLGARLGQGAPPARAVRWLTERSSGNPLFLHHLIDFALERQLLRPGAEGADREPTLGGDESVPSSVRELIEHQLEALGAGALALLEAASAAGVEFSAAEAAAAAEAEAGPVEDACDELARRSLFLARAGVSEWNDGTLTARFRFRHVLHRDVLYARLAPARRRAMHLRIGRRLEAGRADASPEVTQQLARHFDLGGDAASAIRHYQVALEAAARRHAGHEAKELAERALALVPRLAEAERDAAELDLRFALAPALPAALGLTDPALDENLVARPEAVRAHRRRRAAPGGALEPQLRALPGGRGGAGAGLRGAAPPRGAGARASGLRGARAGRAGHQPSQALPLRRVGGARRVRARALRSRAPRGAPRLDRPGRRGRRRHHERVQPLVSGAPRRGRAPHRGGGRARAALGARVQPGARPLLRVGLPRDGRGVAAGARGGGAGAGARPH